MWSQRKQLTLPIAIAVSGLMLGLACGRPALSPSGDDGESDESSPDATSSPSTTSTPTTAGSSSVTTDTSATGPDPSTTGPDDDDGGSTTGSGDSCKSDADCASGYCWHTPVLGGLCGECLEDADCPDGGCSAPNLLAPLGAMCNAGELGGGCQTSEACMPGLSCEFILDVAGIAVITTCSECGGDDTCGPGELCVPHYETLALTGHHTCTPAGTVPLGEGCPLNASGDAACASGHCDEIEVQGLYLIGACAECLSDADCPQGSNCVPGEVDFETGDVIPGYCSG